MTRRLWAICLFCALAWPQETTKEHNVAALAAVQHGLFDKAAAHWEAAARLESDPLASALALRKAGNAQGQSGRFRLALETLERSRQRMADHGRLLHQTLALRSMATIHLWRGDLSRALTTQERALKIARDAGSKRDTARIQLDLADTHRQLGNNDRALALGEAALRGLKRPSLVAHAHGLRGLVHEARGEDAAAREQFERAEFLLAGGKDWRLLAITRSNLALVQMKLGRLDVARQLQANALRLIREHKEVWLEGQAQFHLGRILRRMKDYDGARKSDDEVLRIGRLLDAPALEMRGHLNTAKRALAQKKHADAIAAARAAIERLSPLVSGLAEEQGAQARSYRAEVFEVGVRAAFHARDAEALCFMLESGRAGALLESLGGRDRVAGASVPAELLKRKEAATEAEHIASRALQRLLRANKPTADARRQLATARQAVADVIGRIRRNAKAAAAVVYQEPASLKEIQATLRADEALVLYGFVEDLALALVVTQEAARIVPLGDARKIDRASRAIRGDARRARGGEDDTPHAEALSPEALREMVWTPLKLGSDIKRVLVSPQGALSYAPLARIAGDREVVHVASGSTYRFLCNERDRTGVGILSIGDPTEELPGARAEAKAVGSEVLLGANATEARLAATATQRKRWASVHFACHGVVDSERPMRCALKLAPGAKGDGRLTVLDVFGMRVPSDLVVLSACDTGRGKIYRAEGVVGFTRAFMCAGAPRVIVSLWKVDDDATRALMVNFYSLWKRGMATATALRRAQEFVRGHPKWKRPYFWAAWQLWGLPD